MTSQNFSSNRGSLESLKVSTRWGFMSLARQMRWTLSGEIPTALAMVRTLHRWRGWGGWVARVITCSTVCAGIEAGRPRPFRSSRPSNPSRSKRWDHLFTQALLTPSCLATCCWVMPSPRRNTMAARRLSRWAVVGELRRRWSSVRSVSVISRIDTGRAMRQAYGPSLYWST